MDGMKRIRIVALLLLEGLLVSVVAGLLNNLLGVGSVWLDAL